MINYNWPGNVRMIENIIYRSLVMEDKDSTILNNLDRENIYNLQSAENEIFKNLHKVTNILDTLKLKDLVDDFEKNLIIQKLKLNNGNITNTAKNLGIPRTTLIGKINKYNIKDKINRNYS